MLRFIVFLFFCFSTAAFADVEPCVDNLASHTLGATLNLKTCSIKNPADIAVIGNYLQANPTVTDLMMPDDGYTVYQYLNNNNVSYLINVPTLQSLNISSSWNIDGTNVIELIAGSKTLKSLDISWDFLNKNIINALAKNKSIETLNLTQIYSVKADDLVVLGQNTTLKTLILYSMQINENDVRAIASMPSLESVYLGHPDAEQQVSEATWFKLAANKKLKNIGIVGQHLTPPVIQMLSSNQDLAYLRLIDDDINDQEVSYFTNMPHLGTLILNRNNIGDIGLLEIAENKAVRALGLESNHITELGLKAFAKLSNATILDFSGNFGVTPESLQAILAMPGLESLDVAETGVDDTMTAQLVKLPLHCLNVKKNHITSVGAKLFANEAKIDTLAIYGNEFSKEDVDAIKQNQGIKEVIDDDMGSFGFTSCLQAVIR